VFWVDPATGKLGTLVSVPGGIAFNALRMDHENLDMVAAAVDAKSGTRGYLFRVCFFGCGGILATLTGGGADDLELDRDDTWVVAGHSPTANYLWTMQNKVVTTLFTAKGPSGRRGSFSGVAIDRGSPVAPFALGLWQDTTTLTTPRLVGADRFGVRTTLHAGSGGALLRAAAVDPYPTTGGYLVASEGAGGSLVRVNRKGAVRAIAALPYARAMRRGQDDTAWVIAGAPAATASTLYRIDLIGGRVLTIIPITGPTKAFQCTGVEVYGSRRLSVRGSGQPGTSSQVRLMFRSTGDGGKAYVVACSFGQQPTISLGGGMRLDLAPDPLFFVSVGGTLPGTFQGFSGVLDAWGSGKAWINIPAGIPRNLGIPIFVGAAIYDSGGIRRVSNVHWLVID
jgi:hypothetical protein